MHLNKLDSKSYWEALPCTPDFVAMFVPSDEVVLAARRVDRKLAEDVHAKRVVIVSPMNLMALLRVIALGWRQEKLAAHAQEVASLGRDLHKRLSVFARKLRGLGKRIGTLLKSWNEVVGSFDHNVLPASRRFAELGVVPADQEIQRPDALPFAPREVQGRGLPELEAGHDDGLDEHAAVVALGIGNERNDAADDGDHQLGARHDDEHGNGSGRAGRHEQRHGRRATGRPRCRRGSSQPARLRTTSAREPSGGSLRRSASARSRRRR